MDSTQSLVQINLYQSQIHPCGRGFVRESRAPGGVQCGAAAGRRATAGREVGQGARRAVGQVSRGRLILGRAVVASAAALAGDGPGSVTVGRWPWPDGGRVGGGHRAVPGASGGFGCAAGHTLALPGDRRRGGWRRWQSCQHANRAAVNCPCCGEFVPDSRPRRAVVPLTQEGDNFWIGG